ncbi:unnamed protein product [Brachionus calyciflorus]|uniref:Ubiquitin-like protease family profile domain-containing protein n=1 Tax=Brachionus calyciflorus TaxID=104777 RepID=A0A813WNU9_9BILA|nr:unnamed protein product [Brachionus calyciflorus]
MISDQSVEVKPTFRLLGVTIDNKLQFLNHSNFSNNSTNLKQTDQSPNQNLNKSTVASTKPDKCSSVTATSSNFDQNKNKIDCSIIKGFGIQLLQNDLQSITTGEKLNDKIVNFYLSLLSNSLENLKALTFDSILINKILSSDLRGISRALIKYNQKKIDILFFPIFLKNGHWALLVMESSKNSAFFFDWIFEIDAQLISNIIAVLSKYIISNKY